MAGSVDDHPEDLLFAGPAPSSGFHPRSVVRCAVLEANRLRWVTRGGEIDEMRGRRIAREDAAELHAAGRPHRSTSPRIDRILRTVHEHHRHALARGSAGPLLPDGQIGADCRVGVESRRRLEGDSEGEVPSVRVADREDAGHPAARELDASTHYGPEERAVVDARERPSIRGAIATAIPSPSQRVRVGDDEAMLLGHGFERAIRESSEAFPVATAAVQRDDERGTLRETRGNVVAHRACQALYRQLLDGQRLEEAVRRSGRSGRSATGSDDQYEEARESRRDACATRRHREVSFHHLSSVAWPRPAKA